MRSDFLRFVPSPNGVPKIYYNILYVYIHILNHNNFARVTLEPGKPFNGSISAKLVIMILF